MNGLRKMVQLQQEFNSFNILVIMKKLLILGAVLMSVPFVSFAQAGTSAPTTAAISPEVVVVEPGFLPDDLLYFLDRWSEALNMAITFNKEKKARKHLEYAKERVAEMGEVLKDSTAKLDDIADAKADFDERVQEAALLVKEEKDKGVDVADLARELDDELDDIQDALEDVFSEHIGRSGQAASIIQEKLANLSADDPQMQGLKQALESITKEKDNARKEHDDLDADLSDEEELFEEVMGKEMAAKKHMEQALFLRERLEGALGQVPTQTIQLMKQAQEAIQRGDFEAGKRMSEEAERVIEMINKSNTNRPPVEMPMMGTSDGMMDDDDMSIEESNINFLEEEIKKGERMMDEFHR